MKKETKQLKSFIEQINIFPIIRDNYKLLLKSPIEWIVYLVLTIVPSITLVYLFGAISPDTIKLIQLLLGVLIALLFNLLVLFFNLGRSLASEYADLQNSDLSQKEKVESQEILISGIGDLIKYISFSILSSFFTIILILLIIGLTGSKWTNHLLDFGLTTFMYACLSGIGLQVVIILKVAYYYFTQSLKITKIRPKRTNIADLKFSARDARNSSKDDTKKNNGDA